MTEAHNLSDDGGLDGALIRNRSVTAEAGYAYPADDPVYWRTVGAAEIALDKKHKLNDALDLNLALTIKSASAQQPAGIVNAGYWGIALRPDTVYAVSLYAKVEGESGPLTVALAKAAWAAVTSATVQGVGTEWKKFELTLHVAPRTQTLRGIAKEFTLTLPAYSVAVLEFEVQ